MSEYTPTDPQAFRQLRAQFEMASEQLQGTDVCFATDTADHLTFREAHAIRLGEGERDRISVTIIKDNMFYESTLAANGRARSRITRNLPNGEVITRTSKRPDLAKTIAECALKIIVPISLQERHAA